MCCKDIYGVGRVGAGSRWYIPNVGGGLYNWSNILPQRPAPTEPTPLGPVGQTPSTLGMYHLEPAPTLPTPYIPLQHIIWYMNRGGSDV